MKFRPFHLAFLRGAAAAILFFSVSTSHGQEAFSSRHDKANGEFVRLPTFYNFAGTWVANAQITNCAGVTTNLSTKLISADHSGTVSETNTSGSLRSTAFGVWERAPRYSGFQFVYYLHFFRFNSSGAWQDSVQAKWNVAMEPDGKSYTGSGDIQIVLPNGVVVANLCGTETGLRMEVPY